MCVWFGLNVRLFPMALLKKGYRDECGEMGRVLYKLEFILKCGGFNYLGILKY